MLKPMLPSRTVLDPRDEFSLRFNFLTALGLFGLPKLGKLYDLVT